ncbi:MAG: hypothetical protein EXS11_09025 [Gemmataceae bacterium]|nr:hypothetical protein [Gemmataceae bacterium]
MGISDHATTLDNFKGRARLFPLPNLVLFPHVVQPLHIFEPRYRQMMRECLLDDRVLAMALVTTKHGSGFFGDPPLHPVICVGKVFKEEILPDGRINLLLHGVARGRILEEEDPEGKLYRSAKVELLDEIPPASFQTAQELRKLLSRSMAQWFAPQPAALVQLRKLIKSELTLGTLCDVFSFALPLEIEIKQGLLELVDVETRANHLLEEIQKLDPPEPEIMQPMTRRKFPPDFSLN